MVGFGLSALLFCSLEMSLYTTLLGLQGAQSRLMGMHKTIELPIHSEMRPKIYWYRTFGEK